MDKDKAKMQKGSKLSDDQKFRLPLFVKYGLIALAVVVAIAVGLVLYFDAAGSTIAAVDGERITTGEFMYYFEAQKQMMYYSALQADPNISEDTFWATKIGGEDAVEVAKKKTIDQLKNVKVQYKKAKEANISLTDEEKEMLNSMIQTNIIDQMGGGNEIKANKELAEYGFKVDDVRQAQLQTLLVDKYQQEEIGKISGNIETYYKNNPDWYKEDTAYRYELEEAVWAKHILIMASESATQEEKDTALKKAEDLIERLKNGEDFAALARENSEDGSSDWGGDYLFGRGKMVSEFEDAAFSLEPGAFTQTPVKTQYGYHIIKLEEKYAKGETVSLRCAKEYYEYGAPYVYINVIEDLANNAKYELKNSELYSSIR